MYAKKYLTSMLLASLLISHANADNAKPTVEKENKDSKSSQKPQDKNADKSDIAKSENDVATKENKDTKTEQIPKEQDSKKRYSFLVGLDYGFDFGFGDNTISSEDIKRRY